MKQYGRGIIYAQTFIESKEKEYLQVLVVMVKKSI
jgi:glutathione synthase/RimK-type ligase-like ATP-grasp enzyme